MKHAPLPLALLLALLWQAVAALPATAQVQGQGVLDEALYEAVQQGDPYRARQLLMEGADASAAPGPGRLTPLALAVSAGQPPLVKLLLEWGANPDTPLAAPVPQGPKNRQDFTALHLAALRADAPLAQALLAAGASVNTTDTLGRTPLHWAAEAGHLHPKKPNKPLTSLLLQSGADLDTRDKQGLTPLALAREVAGEPAPPPSPPLPEEKEMPVKSPAALAPPPAVKPPAKVLAKAPAVVKPARQAPTPKSAKPAVKSPPARPATKPAPPTVAPGDTRWVRLTKTAVRLRSAPSTAQGTDTGRRLSRPTRLKWLATVKGREKPGEAWFHVIGPGGKGVYVRADMAALLPTAPAAGVPQPVAPPASPSHAVLAPAPMPLPAPPLEKGVEKAFVPPVQVTAPQELRRNPRLARPLVTLKNPSPRLSREPQAGAPAARFTLKAKLPLRAIRVARDRQEPERLWVQVSPKPGVMAWLRATDLTELPWFGSDQDPRTDEDKALLLAARRGDLTTAQKLFDQTANLDTAEPGTPWQTPYAGWTPLHWAAERGFADFAAWLVKNGAHPHTPDAEGRPPLLLARWRGRAAVVKLLGGN